LDTVVQLLQDFKKIQREEFDKFAANYYKSLSVIEEHNYRRALARLFMPTVLGGNARSGAFDWKFMDLGLVYRYRVDHGFIEYNPLCPAALDALLNLYKKCPMPNDMVIAANNGTLDGTQFEEFFFQRLLTYPDVTFDATNLAGAKALPVTISIRSYKMLSMALGQTTEDTLVRGYRNFKRFDFILGRMFIQVSISDFTTHNIGTADIALAFQPDATGKNDIEQYLDARFGGTHTARYNRRSGKFTVSKNGRSVDDFKIVYICGKSGNPNHTGKVQEFPDVVHVNYDEVKKKLLGNMVKKI
jgi:hypothetical protein